MSEIIEFTMSDLSFPVIINKYHLINHAQMFDMHQHRAIFQVFLVEKGSIRFLSHSQEFILSPNQFLVINCGDFHYGETLTHESVLVSFKFNLEAITQSGLFHTESQNLLALQNGMLRIADQIDSPYIHSLLIGLLNECQEHRIGYELNALGGALRILATLIRDHQSYSLLTPSSPTYQQAEKVKAIISYIKENYPYHISLHDLAEISNMSEGYLCRLFKLCTGSNLTDYINRFRIEKAAYMLNVGDESITEIAQACGFNDSSYFSRMFKHYMKKSPSEFKKDTYKCILV